MAGPLEAPRVDAVTTRMTLVAGVYGAGSIARAPHNSRYAETDEATGGMSLPVAPEVMDMTVTVHTPVPHASPPVGTSIALAHRRSPVQTVAWAVHLRHPDHGCLPLNIRKMGHRSGRQ